MNNTHGLLGQLYYYFKSNLKVMKSTNQFMEFLTGNKQYQNNTTLWSRISKYDSFTINAQTDAFNNLSKENDFINGIKNLLKNLSVAQRQAFNSKLIEILNNVDTYGTFRTSKGVISFENYTVTTK